MLVLETILDRVTSVDSSMLPLCFWIWCLLLLQGSMSLADISDLTDSGSDHEPSRPSCPVPDLARGESFPSVSELSEESGESEASCDARPNLWRRKRSAKSRLERSAEFKKRMTNETNLRAILGKRCVKCRQNCLQKFSSPQQFAKLSQFRKHWADLHKLGQDTVVPRCLMAMFFSFSRFFCFLSVYYLFFLFVILYVLM